MRCKKQKLKQKYQDIQTKHVEHVGNRSIINNNERKNKRKQGTNEENGEMDDKKCGCGMDAAFPSWTPLGVMILTLAIRIDHVSRKANWWILHPDEIFQSVEVAFSEVYGYGFRPYEYLSPPVNVTTAAEEPEIKHGMYSLRSLLFPRVFMAVFYLAKWIGIGESPFLISKIFQAAVTSLLPVSVYRFVRHTHGCHCLSSVACIFTAFSLHLTVLGTHTLVNSFLSPFFFFALTPLSSLLVNRQKNDQRKCHKNDFADIRFNRKEVKSHRNGFPLCAEHLRCDREANMENLLSKYLFWIVKYTQYLFCGFLLGVICYIRVDTCITLAVICLSFVVTFSTFVNVVRCLGEFFVTALGVLLGFILGGYEDYSWYGVWFISPIQWLKFNVGNDISSTLFGFRGPWLYVEEIFLEGLFMSTLYFISSCVLLFSFIRKEEKLSRDRKMTTCFVICSIILFLVYSNVGHKDVRFLHNFIVLQMLIVSSASHLLLHKAGPVNFNKSTIITYTLLVFHIFNTLFQCPNHLNHSHKRWAYKNDDVSAALNACIDYVGRSENVRGVLIAGSIYATGGFTLLRKDTPILIRIHNEYHEYSRNSTALRYRHGLQHSLQLRVVNRLTDFIDVSNILYLRKILLERSEYNYLVIKNRSSKFFIGLGYEEKYTFGEFTVCERHISRQKELELFKQGSKLHVGDNATVLEYEGSWLLTSDMYEKAIERLERSLKLDDSRIRPFQLLGLSYFRSNQRSKMKETESRCFKRHGKEACMTPQRRLVLHSDNG